MDMRESHRVASPGDTAVLSLVGALPDPMVTATARPHDLAHQGRDLDHEHVTILFTDLVSWTQLSSRLSPDVADRLRRRHFATLHRAIVSCGGTEVKTLGDGAMAVFSMASAALSCAVAMQRAVDTDNCVGGHALGLRVGLSGGEVTREDGDCFGDPVVEAARLCACASSGQILAAQVVKAMAGRRGRFPYRGLGPLELKGFPEPLETFEVGWEPAGARDVPWSNAMEYGGAPGLPPRTAGFGTYRGEHVVTDIGPS